MDNSYSPVSPLAHRIDEQVERDVAEQMKPLADIMAEIAALTHRMSALSNKHKTDASDVGRFYENACEWAFEIQRAIRS